MTTNEGLWAEVAASTYAGNLRIRRVRVGYDMLPLVETRMANLGAKLAARGAPFAWRSSDARTIRGLYTVMIEIVAPFQVKTDGWRVAALIEPDQIVAFETGLIETVADVGRCDHCRTHRARKQAFVLISDEDGSRKVVGSSCLKEFVGWNPRSIINDLDLFREVDVCVDELGDSATFRMPGYRTTEWNRYLAVAIESIRKHGFVSKKMQEENPKAVTTADSVAQVLAMDGLACEHVVEAEDAAKAEVITAWLDTQTADNGYMETLKRTRELGCVGGKVTGHVASLPHAYALVMAKLVTTKDSAHVGTVGKRETFQLTLTGKREFDSEYGVRTLVSFKDVDGNEVAWWCTGAAPEVAEVGATLYVTGTVKQHGEYKGRKQTTLTRCTLSLTAPEVKKGRKKAA